MGQTSTPEAGRDHFLDTFLAPAFGYDPDQDSIWGDYSGAVPGDDYGPLSDSPESQFIPTFDPTQMELAQEQFYNTIGTVPTEGGFSPFAWDTLAGLDPGYANSLLSGYGTGASQAFGGDIGTEYGVDMDTARTSYIESARTERESLRKDTKTLYGKMAPTFKVLLIQIILVSHLMVLFS